MAYTFDEIRAMLAEKFSKEKKRLKSFGTKSSSFDLANSVARHVESMMTASRHSELRRLDNKLAANQELLDFGHRKNLMPYIQERLKATSSMAKAIKTAAETADSKRPWGERKKKDKHRSSHGRASSKNK